MTLLFKQGYIQIACIRSLYLTKDEITEQWYLWNNDFFITLSFWNVIDISNNNTLLTFAVIDQDFKPLLCDVLDH